MGGRFLFLILLCLAGAATARDASAPVVAARVDAVPVVDGLLTDPVWERATPITDFEQAAPQQGGAPTLASELRVIHDGQTLYIALRAFHSAQAPIAARTFRRDSTVIQRDDHVAIVLDTAGGARNGFLFRVNANGAQEDGLVFDGARYLSDWDGLWSASTQVNADGWTVEIAIPLATLGAPAAGRDWRFNVQRFTSATGERASLFGAARGRSVASLGDAGLLSGVTLETRTLGLLLRPSATLDYRRKGDDTSSLDLRPSLDAYYLLAPGVTLSSTFNNDFADAEQDDRVINLARFQLFRPEKRLFFTQDAGRFSFGGLTSGSAGVVPFFSRRVALGETLDAGAKVSGAAGPIEFGALFAQVERGDRARSPRLGVVRVAGNVAAEHRFGFLGTIGNPDGTPGSSLWGFDYLFRSTDVFGGRALDVFAWGLGSSNRDLGTGQAKGARLVFENEGPWGSVQWRKIDERFFPALGFLGEAGLEKVEGEAGWQFRLDNGTTLLPRLFFMNRDRNDGTESSGYVGPNLQVETVRGDQYGIEVLWEREKLAAPFEVLPDTIVTAGDRRWRYFAVYANASAARAVYGSFYVRRGGFFDGRLAEETIDVAWRPSAHWSLSQAFNRYDVRLPTGRFIARTSATRVDYASSARLQHSLIVQYDNVSERTGIGLRSRWLVGLGRELQFEVDRNAPLPADEVELRVALRLRWSLEW